jgi:hypothetical protein
MSLPIGCIDRRCRLNSENQTSYCCFSARACGAGTEYGPIAAPDFARLSHCKGLGVAIPLTFFHTPFLRGHFHREIDYERKLGAGSTMRYCAIRSHHSSRQQPFAQSKNVWPACRNQVDIGGRALQGSIATSLIPSQINIEGHLDLLALQ